VIYFSVSSNEKKTSTYTEVDTYSFPSVPTEDIHIDENLLHPIIEKPIDNVSDLIQKQEEIPSDPQVESETVEVPSNFLGEVNGIRSLLPATSVIETSVIPDVIEHFEQNPKILYPALHASEAQISIQSLEDPRELAAYKSIPIEESFDDQMANPITNHL
jgi:hypothetical protein